MCQAKGRSEKSKLVKNLLDTLGAKSSETKDHALRMARLAVELGEKLELPNDDLNKLNLLAILHDIGKATISEEILTKSGKLSDEEWEIIKEHPAKGKAIAAASEEFLPIAKYILHHHESYDGSGYPDGLAGDEIPLLSRIISIIDAYDVMTHSRSYNKVKSREEAVEEIRECAGTQFDPYLAENFIEMINKEDDFKPQDNSVI